MFGPFAAQVEFRRSLGFSMNALPLATVISPVILTLRALEAKRVPTWLVVCPRAYHHARQFLDVDGQDQAAIGTCGQGCSHQSLLCGPDQNEQQGVCPAGLAAHTAAHLQGLHDLIPRTQDQQIRRFRIPILAKRPERRSGPHFDLPFRKGSAEANQALRVHVKSNRLRSIRHVVSGKQKKQLDAAFSGNEKRSQPEAAVPA
jgi:hypothetical protein